MTIEQLRKMLQDASKRVHEAADVVLALPQDAPDEKRHAAVSSLTDAETEANRCRDNLNTAEAAQRARDAFKISDEPAQAGEKIVDLDEQRERAAGGDRDTRIDGFTGEARVGLGMDVFVRMSNREARGGTGHFGEFCHKLVSDPTYRNERKRLAGAQEKRVLAEGTTSAGGALVPPQYVQDILDLARAQAVAFKAGVQMRQTNTNLVYLPSLTAGATAAWVAENGAVTPTDQTFAQPSLSVSKLMAGTKSSNELVNDSDPMVGEIIRNDLAAAIALKLDLGIFEGTGTSPEIRGIANTSGVTTQNLGANGAALTIDNLLDGMYALNAVNITDYESWAMVAHPRVLNGLRKIKDTTGNYILAAAGGTNAPTVAPSVLGLPIYLSSQLSIARTVGTGVTNTNVYFGRFSDAIAMMNGPFTLDVTNDGADATNSGFWSDQLWFRAKQRVGFLVRRPYAFNVITGVL
ncbi:MAG: phage major capsid protein [Actinobacteria bacterium]|nr:phage major capsid protein [Actinomycetota bacterium]